jgi:DNA-binding IclR family transcriptional regulator
MTRTIKSVRNTTELVEHLQRFESGTVSGLAEATGLAPGTVHAHLATLRETNYVVKDDGTYRLGPKFLAVGEYVRNHADIYRAAKEQIEELADETGESAHLIIEHDGKLFALYERFGQNAVGVEYHDRKREHALNHLHCTAAGKAILSQLPEAEVRAILRDRGMPRNTEHTITDADALLDDLATVRDRGYAFADEEQMRGLRAVGAPVTLSEAEVEGAIAVSGPTSRLKNDKFRDAFPELIQQVANICEVNLQTIRSQSLDGASE